MSESFKICPICGASNNRNARICATCGTTLTDVETKTADQLPKSAPQQAYDYRYGETDLYESNLARIGQTYLAGIGILLVVLMLFGAFLAFGRDLFSGDSGGNTAGGDIEATFTLMPTVIFPTVTQGSPTVTRSPTPTIEPTPTVTPTREPCMPTVQAGEGLFNVLPRCGHRLETLDIIDIVVELNGLSSPADLREGQVLEVPWPTETPDPNAIPAEPPADEGETNGEDLGNAEATDELTGFNPGAEEELVLFPTATLQPGIQWHTIQSGENIITIGVQYGANVEILSQLNPEIAFSQCDFGLDFGGERCTVFLVAGQRIRVPAPTPIPTLSPTPSGSETPTPSPTATFNAPRVISPSDRSVFTRDELVTLRWIGSGTLGEGQVYRLRVEDLTAGILYTADTIDNTFVLPGEWQGEDANRHEYSWTVSVIDSDNPDEPYFTTPLFTFIWQGRGEEEN